MTACMGRPFNSSRQSEVRRLWTADRKNGFEHGPPADDHRVESDDATRESGVAIYEDKRSPSLFSVCNDFVALLEQTYMGLLQRGSSNRCHFAPKLQRSPAIREERGS
jgi:hypothetical protein